MRFFRRFYLSYIRLSSRKKVPLLRIVRKLGSNKKLSCCRKAARSFASLKMLLSHSRLFKVTQNYTDEQGVCIRSSYHESFVTGIFGVWYCVTLKPTLWVTRRHWKWHHSKAWIRSPIRIPYSNYGHIFNRFDTIHERDRQTDTQPKPATQPPYDSKGRAYA